MVLKGLIINNFHLGGCGGLDRFSAISILGGCGGLESTDFR